MIFNIYDFLGAKYFTGIKVVGEILGIIGGVIGKKLGGILIIVESVVALIGGGLFGILPFIFCLWLVSLNSEKGAGKDRLDFKNASMKKGAMSQNIV